MAALTEDLPFAELARAYDRGLLTPFTGAGISALACPLWQAFVEDLEDAAQLPRAQGDDAAALIRRASAAVRVLRNRDENALADAVRISMYRKVTSDAGKGLPPQLHALASIWWPLVLTTNYESLFLDEWNRRHVDGKPLPEFNRMRVVGRGRADCQRVLNSTKRPDNPLLWALQGFVSREFGPDLADQLAIGHEEYRRQTHESVHFRRAFAEIYRSRVLLFVGSGLTESYLLDLFGEALELMGAVNHFHYALVQRGTADADFLLRRFQIRTIEYDVVGDAHAHGARVARSLGALKERIDGPRVRSAAWNLKLSSDGQVDAADLVPDLTIVRAPLFTPALVEPETAIAISAGIDQSTGGVRLLLGTQTRKWLQTQGLAPRLDDLNLSRGTYVWRVMGKAIYLVAARDLEGSGSDARDVRHVAPATRELMECASADGYQRVSAMLLSAGGQRTFPQYISLHEMIRGYRQWFSSADHGPRIPLKVHVVDPSVIGLLNSGRFDPAAAAESVALYFWVQISRGPKTDAPVLDFANPNCAMRDIVARHAVQGPGWQVSVRPAPVRDHLPVAVEKLQTMSPTLGEFGITDGATLVFAKGTEPHSSTPQC